MTELPKINEIDISKQARALAWLRLTDYALVVLCGGAAVAGLVVFAIDFASITAEVAAGNIMVLGVFGFGAYAGWRHIGVIDPTVWRAYRIVFPVLVVFCLAILWVLWVQMPADRGLASILEAKGPESLSQLGLVTNALWIGSVSLLGWIALMLLGRAKIVTLDDTVDRVLSKLAAHAGTSALQATKLRRINTPWGLAIGGAGALVLLAVILTPEPDAENFTSTYYKIMDQLKLLGFFLLVRARRYFQVDAESLLGADQRPPMLFLRSFDDDEKQQYASSQRALLDFSLEDRLSNHFFRFGPFIAVGSPKESVPQIGAARVLLRDDEWQGRVLDWMKQASVIVMYSGTTQWVNWELRQVIELGRATNLILMFPEIKGWRPWRRRESVEARAEKIREVFRNTPWNEELTAYSDFACLRAMLFRADGSMVMIRSRSRSRDAYHLAALVAHQQLLDPGPVALGVGEREPRTRRSWAVAAGATAAVMAVLALMIFFTLDGDSRIAFGRGEVSYRHPVTEAEARRVGEALVQEGYFSEERGGKVEVHRDGEQYRLRFVVDRQLAENAAAPIVFRAVGSSISQYALRGQPVELDLVDDSLALIKTFPSEADDDAHPLTRGIRGIRP